jgi:uncharacterized repeat protein (TIGR03803 family)
VKRNSFNCHRQWQLIRPFVPDTFSDRSRRELFNSSFLSAAFVLFLFGSEPRAGAQVTILHSFGDESVADDGSTPQAGLVQAPDGNFYGTTLTQAAGTGGGGTIFQITPAGVLKVVNHLGTNEFSDYPLLYHGKVLIGVLSGHRFGVLFAVTGYPDGPWAVDDWHIFGTAPDGEDPAGSLIVSGGDLYGTTRGGGSAKLGAIYKVNPGTHKVNIVHSFSGSGPGIWPNTALLRVENGNLYGGTQGLLSGEIYEMRPDGKVKTFYPFPGHQFPTSRLIEGSDGKFYGTSFDTSSPNHAYVFQLTATGVVTVLHTFNGTVGTMGVTEGPNGNLYGLTDLDGTAGKGTVFEVSADGSSFAVLHNFGDGTVPNDGNTPVGTLVVGTDNYLYGTTAGGGSAGLGTVFRISP